MYIRVKLFSGLKEPLTYAIPESWIGDNLVGTIVEVPLQKRKEVGIIEEVFAETGPVDFIIREALSKDLFPTDPLYTAYIAKLSNYYALEPSHFFYRIRHFLREKELETAVPEVSLSDRPSTQLTDEQQAVVDALIPPLKEGVYFPALLQGVTGSGKTEVYKKLIIEAALLDKSTLFLVPEVSLAVQFTRILKSQLPAHIPIFSFHSATSITEKKALWQHLLNNKSALIIGVHLPILLPIPKLGLILIDEEHDVGFQEKKHPRVNTKEAALLRAQLSSIPLIAGSATPSISSLYNVEHRGWHSFSLTKRFSGAFPTVRVIKLTEQKQRRYFWFSKELEEAIKAQLTKKEQTIIFLNRRGFSFFIQCKSCGSIPQCIQCSVSLTLHNDKKLLCHYCSFTLPVPETCTQCTAGTFLKKGIGTQQVVSLLEKMFPHASIARADLDTTVNKKQWTQTLKEFEEGKTDILVGTQTITKGYHFPKVTLVGILWADINLSIPFYNAAEVTLQQLIQVSGRAGRQSADSTVIVQTMINHPLFQFITEQQYPHFYHTELKNRRLVNYPPCVRFAEIELKHEDEAIVIKEAARVAQEIKSFIETHQRKMVLLGPSEPPVQKIKNIWSRKIYLKAVTMQEILAAYASLNKGSFKSFIGFTPNPLS